MVAWVFLFVWGGCLFLEKAGGGVNMFCAAGAQLCCLLRTLSNETFCKTGEVFL